MLKFTCTILKCMRPSPKLVYVRQIAVGGFGEVWECQYKGKTYACKIINKKSVKVESATLLENELNIWAMMNHPHILSLHYVISDSIRIHCISELLEESMHDVHVRMVRLGTKPRVITLIKKMMQICDAMSYVHAMFVVHRDLKSSNILCRGDDIFIADFGLARFRAENMTSETGSYRWMAPEVIVHQKYSDKCDVYSFAMVQYEMITLCVPFCCYSPVETAFEVARGKRPPLPPLNSELIDLIERCWDPVPERRPTFDDALITLNSLGKDRSYGCLEMSASCMKRIRSRDCVL